jgi:hypothetical protein
MIKKNPPISSLAHSRSRLLTTRELVSALGGGGFDLTDNSVGAVFPSSGLVIEFPKWATVGYFVG